MQPARLAGIRDIFSLDLRSLALFRGLLGLMILVDLAHRLFDLRAHYTDFGVLPRSALSGEFNNIWHLSVHMWSGSVPGQLLVFAVAALAGAALMLGYRTRVATAVSWFLLISLENRNPVIIDGGDMAFRLFLFWGMFLPLGAVWSVDALRSGEKPASPGVFSAGSAALFLQLCIVYWLAAILKTDAQWRTDFTAVHYALSVDAFTSPIGIWLRDYRLVMVFLAVWTMLLEGFGPFLFFIPVAQGPIRTAAVLLFMMLHAGFGLCMHLGVFPLIMISGWCSIFPGWLWDKLGVPLHMTAPAARRLRAWLPGPLLIPDARSRWEEWKPAAARLASAFCTFCLLYVIAWNIRTTHFDRYKRYFPAQVNFFANTLRIDQMWNMFAPKPLSEDGWYVIPAKLRGGREIDLYTGAPVDWNKPLDVASYFGNQRWRKYRLNLWQRDFEGHRLYYGRYLCRSWNETHSGPDAVESFDIIFMLEVTPPYGVPPVPEKRVIWSHKCT